MDRGTWWAAVHGIARIRHDGTATAIISVVIVVTARVVG